jgi:hypothetical protein
MFRRRPALLACAVVGVSYVAIGWGHCKLRVLRAMNSVNKESLTRADVHVVEETIKIAVKDEFYPADRMAAAVSKAAEQGNAALVSTLRQVQAEMARGHSESNYDAAARAITTRCGYPLDSNLSQILHSVLIAPDSKTFVHQEYASARFSSRPQSAQMWEAAVKHYSDKVPHEQSVFAFLESRVSFDKGNNRMDNAMGCMNSCQWVIDTLAQAVSHKQPRLVKHLLVSPFVRSFSGRTFLASLISRACWSHSVTSYMASPVQLENFLWAFATVKEWPQPLERDLLDMTSSRVPWKMLKLMLDMAAPDVLDKVKPQLVAAAMWRAGPDHETLKGLSEMIEVPQCSHKYYSDICAWCVVDKPNKRWPTDDDDDDDDDDGDRE